MSLYPLLSPQNHQPHAILLHRTGEHLTHVALRECVARARTWIHSKGLKTGDVIAIQMEKSPLFLQLLLACFAEGVVALPLNPQYTTFELPYFLKDSAAALVISAHAPALNTGSPKVLCPAEVAAEIERSLPRTTTALQDDNAPAVLMYTSGTTGRPKGALLTHGNIKATVEALHQAWGWEQSDILLHALPLFHVHGLFVAQFVALRAGATSVWLDRFTPVTTLKAIEEHSVTIMMGVPTFYARLLATPEQPRFDLSSIRLFTSGSAPLAATVHQNFERRFGHRILERYGMTEIGIVLSNPLAGERRPGSVGMPLPGVRARIADFSSGAPLGPEKTGEVHIQGPSVFHGYLNRPDANAQTLVDGWMRTGDIGRCSQDGYYYLAGRMNDTIISGGMNVYPAEVASTLSEHEEVIEVAVLGISDEDLGQRVVALVVCRGEELDLRPWLRERLAGYKCPKEVRFLSALPRNAMGKVDRRALHTTWETPASTKP
jgi:malonyl-CoA/methylmalonyl-CoA synthetase